ncbi:hypothetical protein [Streptomyces yanii]|uniref:Uncharacterized protein n=1 Tax=Streptomyces yanii TaxID=78510 RepID=A0ABV5RCJ3_9ACTN
MGLAPDLTLAGFLVAEHRQVEDLWLHWTAKNISFDTALGYHLYHLLTGGIAATVEVVRASAHPERDRILKEITSSRHTDAAVENGWKSNAGYFPPTRLRRARRPGPTTPRASASARHRACS